jgi:hypothetical protein
VLSVHQVARIKLPPLDPTTRRLVHQVAVDDGDASRQSLWEKAILKSTQSRPSWT